MEDGHKCKIQGAKSGGYGAAIHTCYEKENDAGQIELWVENGEYATQVNYCPFCGYEAQTTIQEADPDEEESEDESHGTGIPPCNNGMIRFSEDA